MIRTIVPNLWFDIPAEQAAAFHKPDVAALRRAAERG